MICYIILHFQVENETVTCVNQLKKISGDHQIIIVDNCSPNGSGKILAERYKDDIEVDVILHNKNDGFARGNNIGCKYAKEKYNPDFYVVMNNDIEITQSDFETLVYQIYSETDFDVLGPDIFSTSGNYHQSPKSITRTSIERAELLLKGYKNKCKSKVIVPLKCHLKKIKGLKNIKNQIVKKQQGVDYNKQYINVPLHGSCVIFTRRFLDSREYAFFPETFFYYEMEILDYECNLFSFKEVYDPRIRVLHHQNVSTNTTYDNEIKRVRFMNEQNYNSISSFIKKYKVDK